MVKDEVLYKEANYIINKMLMLDVDSLPVGRTPLETRCQNKIYAIRDQVEIAHRNESEEERKERLYQWISENCVLQVRYVGNRVKWTPSYASIVFSQDAKKDIEDLVSIPFILPIFKLRESLKQELSNYPKFFQRQKLTPRTLR